MRTKVRFYDSTAAPPAVLHETNCRSSGEGFEEVWDLPVGEKYSDGLDDGWWEQFQSEFAAQVAALLQALRWYASPSRITWEPDCTSCVAARSR